nr:MAG TPA: hypothetical protein [Caudoviricetes sp.]
MFDRFVHCFSNKHIFLLYWKLFYLIETTRDELAILNKLFFL